MIEVFNWIGPIVRNFVIATVKVLKNFVSSVLTWTKDIVLKFITYVKYVWDGIYDHIIYPFYLYVIYYPFYVGLWQNICLRIYNYGSNLIYNFYCIVWNGIELIWTKLYDTCLSIYANMGGGYERLCIAITILYEHVTAIFNNMHVVLNNMYINITTTLGNMYSNMETNLSNFFK